MCLCQQDNRKRSEIMGADGGRTTYYNLIIVFVHTILCNARDGYVNAQTPHHFFSVHLNFPHECTCHGERMHFLMGPNKTAKCVAAVHAAGVPCASQ